MTDSEILQLCAEAMEAMDEHGVIQGPYGEYWQLWDPFERDEQAMALVKKLEFSTIQTKERKIEDDSISPTDPDSMIRAQQKEFNSFQRLVTGFKE